MTRSRRALLGAMLGFVAAPASNAAEAAAPDLGISLLGVADRVVEQGEPLRIAVRLALESGEAAEADSLTLSPADGSWVDAIEVEMLDARGEPAGARARPAGQPDQATATLAADRMAGGLWRLDGDATRSLAPGSYALVARLAIDRAAPDSGGWIGEVTSEPIPFELVASSTDPRRAAPRALALAHDALLDDRLEEAATILDALLERQPDNLRAWVVRAVVCERAGNLAGALLSLDRAEGIYAALELAEPHPELSSIRSRVLAAVLAEDSGETAVQTVPDWSWPPTGLPGDAAPPE